MAAWKLPLDGPLTEDDRTEAMQNFQLYLDTHGLKYKDVARQVGKPKPTTIRDLCKFVWTSSSDEHVRRLST